MARASRFTTHRRSRFDRGGVLVETALTLPLFFLFVYILIVAGVMMNARASLTAAVNQAARLAMLRGSYQAMGMNVFPAVNDWTTSMDATTSAAAIEALAPVLAFNLPSNNLLPAQFLQRYDQCYARPSFDRDLRELPDQYIYLLLYLNEALRESLGGLVKFPCKPTGDWCHVDYVASADDGPGCVSCRLLDPFQSRLVAQPVLNEFGVPVDPPVDRIAVQCAYQPSSVIMAPLQGLFSLFGVNVGTFVVTARSIVEAPSLGPMG